MREKIEKCVVSYILVVSFVLLPAIGYENGDVESTLPHIAYIFCHANVWHLAGNLFVLWIMRGRLYLIPSLAIAFLCSFIPGFSIYGDVGVTLGFSGVLFAIVGTKWGLYIGEWRHLCATPMVRKYFRHFLMKILPFAVIGIIIPHVNWCLHTYCLLAGFAYGWFRR